MTPKDLTDILDEVYITNLFNGMINIHYLGSLFRFNRKTKKVEYAQCYIDDSTDYEEDDESNELSYKNEIYEITIDRSHQNNCDFAIDLYYFQEKTLVKIYVEDMEECGIQFEYKFFIDDKEYYNCFEAYPIKVHTIKSARSYVNPTQ